MRKEAHKYTWLPKVLLEISGLDEDHQRLLGRVNALIVAVASRTPASVQSALGELRSETEAHFAREETLMLEAQYPRLKQHCARHQRLLRELNTLRVALDASGRLRLPLAPMNYIRRWFAAHIAGDDRMVASYLDEKEDQLLLGSARVSGRHRAQADGRPLHGSGRRRATRIPRTVATAARVDRRCGLMARVAA